MIYVFCFGMIKYIGMFFIEFDFVDDVFKMLYMIVGGEEVWCVKFFMSNFNCFVVLLMKFVIEVC